MNEDQSDEISDRDTMGGPITDQPEGASERAPSEPQAQSARCSVADCSASENRPLEIAIAGYMADRNDLIESLPSVNLHYERDQKKQEWIKQEIDRIDKCVAALLSPKTGDERRSPERPTAPSVPHTTENPQR